MSGRDSALAGFFERLWYGGSAWARWLWPVAACVALLVRIRRFMYAAGWLSSVRVGCPVVVVGNLTVGGTGKTPLVIWLARALTARGLDVGIVCSGYGGRPDGQPGLVATDSDPGEVGDEAVELARATGLPVAAGRDRVGASQLLLDDAPLDVIVSDDGLQHLRLVRDVEVVVVDGTRGVGNGLCLPVGPLREPASRLTAVDAVVVNGGSGRIEGALRCETLPVSARELATGRTVPIDEFRGRRVHAVAAIGNPERFFRSLENAGIEVLRHPHRDHAALPAAAFEFDDGLAVVMTVKDAVKCVAPVPGNRWEIEAELKFTDGAGDSLVESIVSRIRGTHGKR